MKKPHIYTGFISFSFRGTVLLSDSDPDPLRLALDPTLHQTPALRNPTFSVICDAYTQWIQLAVVFAFFFYFSPPPSCLYLCRTRAHTVCFEEKTGLQNTERILKTCFYMKLSSHILSNGVKLNNLMEAESTSLANRNNHIRAFAFSTSGSPLTSSTSHAELI